MAYDILQRHQRSHDAKHEPLEPDEQADSEQERARAQTMSRMGLQRYADDRGIHEPTLVQRRAQQESPKQNPAEQIERAASDSGSALPGGLRERFESSLGADLSGVRVHSGAASASAASAVGAKAYTTGQDIHFAAGSYDPSSKAGQHLLAHEVAHTVQQSGTTAAGAQFKLEVSEPHDAPEQEADRAADAMISGTRASVSQGSASGALARSPEERMDAAAQPVASPLPKPKAGKGTAVSADRAPTVDEVFDPKRPALDGASQSTVLSIIQQRVNALYEHVFVGQLSELKAELGKTAPVPETPFALKLLGWVVETVASGAIGYVGKFLGKELFGEEPAQETTISIGGTIAEPTVTTTTKTGPTPEPNWKEKATEKTGGIAGEKAGGALKDKMLERPTTAPTAEEDAPPAVTTGNLLDEFIVRERHMLLARQSDIVARLMLMHEHAAGPAKADALELGNRLRDLIGAAELTAWFRNKVTMEWLNFVARVSLGPRAEGQTTDLVGANKIDGIGAGGVGARQQWVASDGMVEVYLDVADTVHGTNGLAFRRAAIPSSFGAADILGRIQGTGTYSLATLPVYRRVWLKTGDSKLSETPAFVITPDGAIETDVGNPVLAVIGSRLPMRVGESTYQVGGKRHGDEDVFSPAVTASNCTIGAHLVQDMLRGISPQVLK